MNCAFGVTVRSSTPKTIMLEIPLRFNSELISFMADNFVSMYIATGIAWCCLDEIAIVTRTSGASRL